MKKIKIDIGKAHSTIINWPNQVKQIIDGYRSYHTIAHGVQKDAIQNAWDARIDKKEAKGWEIEFELIESPEMNLFIFTDKGTTGLTGKILLPEDLEKDLPIIERWGRFENVAFTKDPTEHALGARGRGKFIFVGASEFTAKTTDNKNIEKLILYDTYRSDNVYRFGWRTITTTDSKIDAFEGINAENGIKELSNGLLSPLKSIGTRVIIVDPLKEIINDVKNGKLMEYIEETWWEIIKNYDVKIKLKIGDKTTTAKLTDHFKFPENDSKRYKVWTKKNIKLPQAPNYSIRQLQLVYDSQNQVEEDLRGIFIQRGGMKVCSIPVRYLDKTIGNSIYGYIKLTEELETKMQEDEGIEHYSFDFKKQIPKLVKQYIEDELEKFIREKLGINIGDKPKTYEKEKSAELKALYQVNAIAKQLGIFGKGVTGSKIPGDVERESKIKPIRLSYGNFKFPSPTLRVNYGEVIKDIKLILINNTIESSTLGIRFSILFDEDEIVHNFIYNEEFNIDPLSKITIIENKEVLIDEIVFANIGKYTFYAKLVSLNEKNRGEILHQLSKHFWVEENPPQKDIFEDIEAVAYPEELKTIQGEAVTTDKQSFKFMYNSKHPAKKKVESDEEKLTNYLIELMCLELAWIDLRNVSPKIFKEDDLESHAGIVRRLNKFMGEIKYRIN